MFVPNKRDGKTAAAGKALTPRGGSSFDRC
jgi:hypothetical protein